MKKIIEPIEFPEQTKVLSKPANMTDEECSSMPVYNDGTQCISCWKIPLSRRIKILFTGKIWLSVLYGGTQPPVWLSSEYPFIKNKP